MMDSPCKDCETRFLGCHDTCEKYISYRKKMDEIRDNTAKERMAYYNGRHFKK